MVVVMALVVVVVVAGSEASFIPSRLPLQCLLLTFLYSSDTTFAVGRAEMTSETNFIADYRWRASFGDTLYTE
jgi:hypothetical protein